MAPPPLSRCLIAPVLITGHSIHIANLRIELQKQRGVDVPPQQMFANPTIQLQAALVDSMLKTTSRIVAKERPEHIPLSSSQRSLWLANLFTRSPIYNIGVFVQLDGPFSEAAMRKTLEAIAHRHEILRTAIARRRDTGEPYQDIAPDVTVRMTYEAMVGASDEAVHALLMAFVSRPFQLEARPLFRAIAVQTGPQTHVFGFCMHHIIGDGWSLRVRGSLALDAP